MKREINQHNNLMPSEEEVHPDVIVEQEDPSYNDLDF